MRIKGFTYIAIKQDSQLLIRFSRKLFFGQCHLSAFKVIKCSCFLATLLDQFTPRLYIYTLIPFLQHISHLHFQTDISTCTVPAALHNIHNYLSTKNCATTAKHSKIMGIKMITSYKEMLVQIIVANHHVVNLNSLLVQISQCLGGPLSSLDDLISHQNSLFFFSSSLFFFFISFSTK